jgi:isochorismate synthase
LFAKIERFIYFCAFNPKTAFFFRFKTHFLQNMPTEKVKAFAQIYNPYSQKIQFFEGVEEGQSPDFEWTSFDGKQVLGFVKSNKNFEDLHPQLGKTSLTSTSKDAYLAYIDAIKNAIAQKHLQKAVAARTIAVAADTSHWQSYFKSLISSFSDTFVYSIYHPQSGLWIGASPELVGYLSDGVFKTISLAGTIWDQTQFESKEQGEQEIVTDYLQELLIENGLRVNLKHLESKSYGQISHLINEIEVPNFEPTLFENIVSKIHPSPALSGFPKEESIQFIQKNEPIDRAFYSGLVSWKVSATEKLAFATIRCFQVFENQLIFYVGGGITKDSNPETEFEETQRKFQTVYDALG